MDLLKLPLSLMRQIFDFSIGTMFNIVSSVTKPFHSRLKSLITKFKSTTLSLFLIGAVLAVLLWISILLFWSFYYTYIPAVSHTRDVNLIFGSNCDVSRGFCSFPSANMSLLTSGQQPILARGQQYSVKLKLDMPESPVNRELGMFIVQLDFYTKHGEVVRTAHRAAMINYRSTLLRVAETIFFLPMYLLGYLNQKQSIDVHLYNSFTEDPYKPTTGAYVVVQTRFIEIYRATLKIDAQFSGLRYVLFSWPLTSAVVGVGILMFFFTMITLLSWYNLFWADVPAEKRITIKQFTGAVDELNETPETLGVTDEGETKRLDEDAGDILTEEGTPLAAEIRRRHIPEM